MNVSLLLAALFATLLQTSPVQWLETTRHDFGTIALGQPVVHHFRFVNVSSQPLTIDNVRTTCGCTAVEWESLAVAPADTAALIVSYDAARPGFFKKKITVYFHGIRKPQKLWIEGYVE